MIDAEAIGEASRLLDGIAHRTPILRSESLDARTGARLVAKAEHLQRTGSFKIRGAFVRLSKLTADERTRGVIAASAGNHGQGVAWAGDRLGVPVTVVMPEYAALPKIESTKAYGAQVILSGQNFDDALAEARRLAASSTQTFVHAFDDPWIVAGQATVGLELCEDAGKIDRVVVPVGGGGLAAGIAQAVRTRRPEVEIFGVRAAASPATMADGVAVKRPGELTSRLLDDLGVTIVAVGEEAISEAIVLHLERQKQLVEGAGALPLAAVLSGVVPTTGSTALVLSGGNIDPGLLMRVIRHGLQGAGRYLFVRLVLPDRPGELQRVLARLAALKVNVLSVVHHRAGLTLPVGDVEIELTLETRNPAHATEVVGALKSDGYRPAVAADR